MVAKINDNLGFIATLIPEGRGIFDVKVGEQLVYSKFQTGSFPDEDKLVKEISGLINR